MFFPGIWKVISKATSKKEGYIHRLTTQDIERIYQQDIEKNRKTPRSYICTKDIEVSELHLQSSGKLFFLILFYFFFFVSSRSNYC